MTSVDRIQGLSGSLAIKAPVRVATTANITLSGEQTIDGVAVVEDDRVLVKDQTDTTENGIYNASTGTWVRALDFDGANDVKNGTQVLVTAGAVGANLVYRTSGTDPISFDTSALTFPVSLAATAVSAFMATLLDDTSATTARATLEVRGTADDVTLAAGKVVIFEGTTDNAFKTTLTVVDPTAANTVTLPNATCTVAGLEVDQSWAGAQRGASTTDNDLSFDLNATNNFLCTPTAGGTLTFTNHTSGQSGFIKLVNGSNYAIAAAATTKISTADLTKISATGTYLLSYFDDGTNAYVVASANLA